MKLKDYLTEGITITDGNGLLKSFEKGMIPNLSKKKFFNNETPVEAVSLLDTLIDNIKAKNPTDLTSYTLFVLKKLGTFNTLVANKDKLNDWLDSITAYFKNKNKQEFKINIEYKKKLEDFESGGYNYNKDKEFEQFVNEKFADKAKVKDKDKEIKTVYKDSEGWEVYVPLTFAASKELACMNGRKSRWCTAAGSNYFSSYSKKNSLFIIKNPIKDVMFQMNFDTTFNFKNEADNSATLAEFLKYGPPEAMLKAIKNSKGETLLSKMGLSKEISDEETTIEDNWIKKEVSVDILKDKLKDKNNASGGASGGTSIEDIMKDSENFKVFEIKKGEKVFYILDNKDKSKSKILQKQKNGLTEKSLKSLLNAKKEMIPTSVLNQAIEGFETIKSNFSANNREKESEENKTIDKQMGFIKANSFTDFLKYEKREGFNELKKQIVKAGDRFNLNNFIFSLKRNSYIRAISFKNNKFLAISTRNSTIYSPFESFKIISTSSFIDDLEIDSLAESLNIPKDITDDLKFYNEKNFSGIKVTSNGVRDKVGIINLSEFVPESLKLKDGDKYVEWKKIIRIYHKAEEREEVVSYKVEQNLEDIKRLIEIVKKYS